jgi:aspartate/methionine/tyrosine aminotransferase
MKLDPFKLERYFAKYEFNARYLLCSSDCESVTVEDLLRLEPGAEEALKKLWLGYTESPGAPTLRREISQGYPAIDASQVLVCSGAEEAIYLFMHACLQAGDHVVVHWPCYQSLTEVAESIGCVVDRWEARWDNGWTPDLDEFRRLLRADTRAVIVNLPHNPTGYIMPEAEFREINRLTRERGILLFSDEVYRELEYERSSRLPSACEINPTAVSLGVVSKSFGLAGLRIGWAVTRDETVLRRMAEIKDYTTICSSAPSEFLAELALRQREVLIGRNLGIINRNLLQLDGFFQEFSSRAEWVRPKAGSIAFPRLTGEQVESFCRELVEKTGVLLLPGSLYDHPGNYFRLGFGRRNMPEALGLFRSFLERRH